MAEKRKLINLYAMDEHNIGDMCATPFEYIDIKTREVERFDVRKLADDYEGRADDIRMLQENDLIVGGGGMLIHKVLEEVCIENPVRKLVAWGVGHNTHGSRKIEYPGYMKNFDLCGVRDQNQACDWVPCPSCQSDQFDHYRMKIPKHDIAVYEHAGFHLPIDGLPKMDNDKPFISDVLGFICETDTLVTNCYHGVIWGLWMCRKVVAIPFSSKFFGLKYPVPLIESVFDWREGLSKTQEYPEALSEARLVTEGFKTKLAEVFREP